MSRIRRTAGLLQGSRALRGRRALDRGQQDRAVGSPNPAPSRCCGATRTCASGAALDRSGRPREGGPPRHLSEQSRPPDIAAAVGWLYSGLQVMHPGEVASAHAHSASALALHHGRRGRLHHRRRPQDDARRQRLRADAERHLARARRRATARHASGRTASIFPWSTRSKPISMRSIPTCKQSVGYPVDDMTHVLGRSGPAPAGAETGPSDIRRC